MKMPIYQKKESKLLTLIIKLLTLLIAYARLRTKVGGFVRKLSESDKTKLFSNQRKAIAISFLFITVVNFVDSITYGEAHWREYITLLVLVAMILFWAYSAEFFSKLIKEQANYFSGKLYSNQYSKYAKWLGEKETVPGYEYIYYIVWLVIAIVILIYVINLGIFKWGSLIQFINVILLVLVLFASGNSVFATIIFTYFLCDLYYADNNASAGHLTYDVFAPHMTLGIQKLLHDAQAHSTCYLAYALCFVIVLNVNVADDVHILMMDDRFKTVLILMGMICFGLYIVCTIGARYYLRKIVDRWRMEQLKNCQTAIRDVPFSNTTGDWKLIESYTNRIDSLEKCRISLLPSYHEVLFTAAIGVFSKDIILYLFGLFANMV